MDVRTFYRNIAATKQLVRDKLALPENSGHPEGGLYLMSEDDPNKNVTKGSFSCVSFDNGCRLITERMHRLATPEEIRFHLAKSREETDKISQQEAENRRRQSGNSVNVFVNGQQATIAPADSPVPAHFSTDANKPASVVADNKPPAPATGRQRENKEEK